LGLLADKKVFQKMAYFDEEDEEHEEEDDFEEVE